MVHLASRRGAEHGGCGLHEEPAAKGEHRATTKAKMMSSEKWRRAPGPVALAQGLGHKGAAPGADHHAHGGEDHDGGEDQVHGGERRFAGAVRHEEPVHDGVARGEDHHGDGGQREPYEGAGGEMFGHIDWHGETFRRKEGRTGKESGRL